MHSPALDTVTHCDLRKLPSQSGERLDKKKRSAPLLLSLLLIDLLSLPFPLPCLMFHMSFCITDQCVDYSCCQRQSGCKIVLCPQVDIFPPSWGASAQQNINNLWIKKPTTAGGSSGGRLLSEKWRREEGMLFRKSPKSTAGRVCFCKRSISLLYSFPEILKEEK